MPTGSMPDTIGEYIEQLLLKALLGCKPCAVGYSNYTTLVGFLILRGRRLGVGCSTSSCSSRRRRRSGSSVVVGCATGKHKAHPGALWEGVKPGSLVCARKRKARPGALRENAKRAQVRYGRVRNLVPWFA